MEGITDIYSLRIHESIDVYGMRVTRVPGGWLYIRCTSNFYSGEVSLRGEMVFVPYTEEGN